MLCEAAQILLEWLCLSPLLQSGVILLVGVVGMLIWMLLLCSQRLDW